MGRPRKKSRFRFCPQNRVAKTGSHFFLWTRVWPLLLGIVVVSAFVTVGAGAGSKTKFAEKGLDTMQQVAAVPNPDLPPLDAALPARTETFSFGLG